jgi:hypothetical protein
VRRGVVVAGMALPHIDDDAKPILSKYPCFDLHAGV